MNKKQLVVTLTMAGAFISYTVGSGFASGNEVMQFFGSWGIPTCLISLAGAAFITLVSCICLYRLGSAVNFEKTSEAYTFIGGKYLGKFFQVFTFVSVFGTFMIMFTGAGSLLHQHFGLPQWVGSVIMGVLSGIVVLGGLKTVENVLGSVGILLLVYVIVFGTISLFFPGSSLSQADAIPQAVQEGVVYQANLLALPPFSWFSDLKQFNTPWLSGMLYASLCMVNGVPFFLKLGQNSKSDRHATVSAVITTIAFYACTTFVMIIIMMNFNKVVESSANQMQPFPVLSAIHYIWPAGSWTYIIIIFMGIFTTTTGFLWVLSAWLFPGQTRTKKTYLFIVGMIIFGILMGSVLPFSVLIIFIFPISGVVGLLITVCLVVRTVQLARAKKKAVPAAATAVSAAVDAVSAAVEVVLTGADAAPAGTDKGPQ